MSENRNGRHHPVRNQSQLEPIFVTWSLYPKWLAALLEFIMGRPSIKLKLSLKWLVIIWLNFPSLTNLLSMEDLVLVPPILPDSFLWSKELLLRPIGITGRKLPFSISSLDFAMLLCVLVIVLLHNVSRRTLLTLRFG